MTSPHTLIGVLKAQVESKKGERREEPIRRRKNAEIKELREVSHVRDQAPTTVSNEGENSEEI